LALNRDSLRSGAVSRWVVLSVQFALLLAVAAIWGPPSARLLGLALVYVLAVWIAAGGLMLFAYAAFSLAAISDLFLPAFGASLVAMWLVPGLLLLASHSYAGKFAGIAAIVISSRLLAASRPPRAENLLARQPAARQAPDLLFRYPQQKSDFWRRTAPAITGALALQFGLYELPGGRPSLTAAGFATAAAVWGAMSVAIGAAEPRTGDRKTGRHRPGMWMTLLFTVTVSALLIESEVGQYGPARNSVPGESTPPPSISSPGITAQLLHRFSQFPPDPEPPAKAEAAAKPRVAQIVDPTPATRDLTTGRDGVPGVVLRPQPELAQNLASFAWGGFARGAQLRLSSGGPVSIPFTGEYQLFRRSSGQLPAGAAVERGVPLNVIYGTTNGGEMQTVAVQRFNPPIDLTDCGKVVVVLLSAETLPALASIEFAAGARVEEGSIELLGTGQTSEQTLEFQVPVTSKPLLAREIRISFSRPGRGGDRNARIAVQRLALVPRTRIP